MGSVNKIILVGNLGADPEVRHTQGGQPVCNLRVATTEAWTDKDGGKQEKTEWHSVVVWGKTAEHCGQYLAKGRSVYVEGRLETREYTNKDGAVVKAWEVKATNVTFLGGRGEGDGGAGNGGGNQGGGGGNQGGGGGNQGGWGGGGGGGNQGGNQGGWGGGGGGNQGGGGGNQGGNRGRNQSGWGGLQPGEGDDIIPF